MDQIRIGVFGVNRGSDYFRALLGNNANIVAICDKDDFWLNKAKETLGEGVASYSSFDEFINHPMDAVLLANSIQPREAAKLDLCCESTLGLPLHGFPS